MENNVKAGGLSFIIGIFFLFVSIFILPPSYLLSWYDNLWRLVIILLSLIFFVSSYILGRYLVDETTAIVKFIFPCGSHDIDLVTFSLGSSNIKL